MVRSSFATGKYFTSEGDRAWSVCALRARRNWKKGPDRSPRKLGDPWLTDRVSAPSSRSGEEPFIGSLLTIGHNLGWA